MTRNQSITHFLFSIAILIGMFGSSSAAGAQESQGVQSQGAEVTRIRTPGEKTIAPPSVQPVYADFMGVRLGMDANEVREKLKHLKDKSERQDFFVFPDNKVAQVLYDTKGRVVTISVDYVGKDSKAPSPEEVLGQAVPTRADGSLYELKRYPQAGYWVAYSRTAGENPTVTVTLQKI